MKRGNRTPNRAFRRPGGDELTLSGTVSEARLSQGRKTGHLNLSNCSLKVSSFNKLVGQVTVFSCRIFG